METVQRDARSVLVLTGQIGWEATARLRDEAENLAACAMTGSAGVDIDWKESAGSYTAVVLQVLIALASSVAGVWATLPGEVDR